MCQSGLQIPFDFYCYRFNICRPKNRYEIPTPRDFNMYKISYSTKKNGKYKEIRTVYSGSEIQTSTIKELKKGRTYYVRVRFIDKPEYETMYSSYSNKQKVKMP